MGLASKLAASQSGPGPTNYPQYGFPGQDAPQQPRQRQVPGVDEAAIRQRLSHIVAVNGLHTFYPEHRIHSLSKEVVAADLAGLASRWRLEPKLLLDLVALSLYDIVIMADDSGSMKAAEQGTRIDDLKAMLERITDAVTLFDTDGISVRFMNQEIAGNNIRNSQDVINFVNQARYGGLTPLGTMLERKVLQPFVLGPAKAGRLNKPVAVIIITDGEPCGEPDGYVKSAIKDAKKAVSKTAYGEKSVTFQFVQVGRDEDARKFLGKLDSDSKIGGLVDATSYYEFEEEEYRKKNPNKILTPELYLVKLLMGAIDPEYDQSDEAAKKKKSLFSMFK